MESASPVTPRKTELDKVSVEDRMFVSFFYPPDMTYLPSRGEEKSVASSNCVVTINFPKQSLGSAQYAAIPVFDLQNKEETCRVIGC